MKRIVFSCGVNSIMLVSVVLVVVALASVVRPEAVLVLIP